MISFEVLKKILILLLLSLVGIYSLAFVTDKRCDNLLFHANNKDSIEYLNKQIPKNLYKPSVLSKIGYAGIISKSFNYSLFDELNYDPELLGINNERAKIHIHRLAEGHQDFMNPYSIKSVEFADGRNGIFIKINKSRVLGEGLENKKRDMKVISETVVVNCE